jgi:hypothetical protein
MYAEKSAWFSSIEISNHEHGEELPPVEDQISLSQGSLAKALPQSSSLLARKGSTRSLSSNWPDLDVPVVRDLISRSWLLVVIQGALI